MSGPVKLTEAQKRLLDNAVDDNNFRIWYDDDQAKNYMYIRVPVQTLVSDERFGTIMARGFMDQLKSELLAWIKFYRVQKEKNKIISAAGSANGDTLKVMQ